MLVELRNKGAAVRVVYDTHNKPKTIRVGEKMQVDLPDTTLKHLQRAEADGAKLIVTAVKQEVSAPIPALLTAAEVLERSADMNYYQLLEAVKKVAPNNGLPPRPTKAQMLAFLQSLSPNIQT